MQHEDEVRQIAYKIWEEEGYPQGRDQEHWYKAEATWQETQGQMEHMADDLLSRTDVVTPGSGKESAKPGQKRARLSKR